MRYNSQKIVPGTNGKMTENDLYILSTRLMENNNLDYIGTLPHTERAIKTLIMIKQGTKDELIERNKKLYEARQWEEYI